MYPSLILVIVMLALMRAFDRWIKRKAGRPLELPMPVPGLIVLAAIVCKNLWLVDFPLEWWETSVATLAIFAVLNGFALWLSMHIGKNKLDDGE